MTSSSDRTGIVREAWRSVWRYLRALGCEASLADDLVQEVFLGALRRRFDWRSRGEVTAYLRRAARHEFLRTLRRSARRATVPLADAIDLVWTRWRGDDGDDWTEAVRLCLGTLDERSRAALEAKYAEGRSREEIAEAADETDAAVKGLLARARRRLRECVKRRMSP